MFLIVFLFQDSIQLLSSVIISIDLQFKLHLSFSLFLLTSLREKGYYWVFELGEEAYLHYESETLQKIFDESVPFSEPIDIFSFPILIIIYY